MAPKREQTALPTQREVTSTNDFAFWGLDFQEVPFVNLEKKTTGKDSQKLSLTVNIGNRALSADALGSSGRPPTHSSSGGPLMEFYR